MKIAILDYKMGNLASVLNAFKKIGIDATICSDATKIATFDKIILPGVGAFPDAMRHLRANGMYEAILEFVKSGKYLLGICLGMQLLFNKSYEFEETEGLSLIDGEVILFDKTKLDANLKIPQMGWNKLFVKKDTPIFRDLPNEFYLYFVHSYHAICDEKYIIGETIYGYSFASAVCKDNIFGLQPHPEKSHEIGLKILKNFIKVV